MTKPSAAAVERARRRAWRAQQKLVRNGNATQITIPRAILTHLGWLTGEWFVEEVLEDLSLRIRRVTADDFQPTGIPRLLTDNATEVDA